MHPVGEEMKMKLVSVAEMKKKPTRPATAMSR
jgi:hypothetical protein